MAKNTTKTVEFNVNDRVFVTTAATLGTQATGTIEATTKTGWYVVKLDDSNSSDVLASAKGGKVSARQSSMQHISKPDETPKAVPTSVMGQLQAANGNGKPAEAPKAAPTKKAAQVLPTVCPECGGKHLDQGRDEEGNIILECPDDECGWEETFPADKSDAEKMSEALRKARGHYTKDKRPDGSATAHCGDEIAKELRDLEPKEVCELADRVLAVTMGTHYDRYQSLNNGQIRMNSGNRIRSHWKKINEEGNKQEIARVAKILNLTNDE